MEIKDSGNRTEFPSGAVRDMAKGKGRMDLLPWLALIRVSKHYEKGTEKYGEHNWEEGIESTSFLSSAFRHLAKYADGWHDEDHLAAAAFNVLGLIWNEEKHRADLLNVKGQTLEDISDVEGMTHEQAQKLMSIERTCVLRQDTPECNRDENGCQCCDLLQSTDDVLKAYKVAMKALSKEPNKVEDDDLADIAKKIKESGE